MNWQKRARVVLAVAALGLAGVLFALSRHDPPPPPPEEIKKLDPSVNLSSGEGAKLFLDVKGQPDLEVTFKASSMHTDGRFRFEGASVVELAGGKSRMSADVVETGPIPAGVDRPSTYSFQKNVRLESGDGLQVETDAADYNNNTGVLTMPGPVRYRRGRLSGTGTGAIYDRTQELITIQQNAAARVEPDAAGAGAADATASRMLLARGQHSLRMEENARIVTASETLSGNNAIILFTDDETAVKYMELRGNARVEPSVEGRAGMAATDITMTFQPDGQTLQHATLTGAAELRLREKNGLRTVSASWIDISTAPDGRTLTALLAKDKVVVDIPPGQGTAGRVITSDTLDARGDEKRGLTRARFEGRPKFEERPAAKGSQLKTGTATVITLALGGQLDAIERAEFMQNVEFKQGETTATAERAIYYDASNKLELRRNDGAGKEPLVIQESFQVGAREIDMDTATENLDARIGVRTRMLRNAKDAAKAAGSLFEGSDPVIGAADRLIYRPDTGTATYTGSENNPASLTQGGTAVRGLSIDFIESTNQLSAKGRVDSTLKMAATDADAKAGKARTYDVTADSFAYDDTKRVAVYQGGKSPAVLTTSDGTIEGQTLTFTLAQASRTLKSLRAMGAIYARLTGGYEAVGDQLDYDAATEEYTLTSTGKSIAQVKAPEAREAGKPVSGVCTHAQSTAIRFNVRTGDPQLLGSGQALQKTEKKNCDAIVLRPPK